MLHHRRLRDPHPDLTLSAGDRIIMLACQAEEHPTASAPAAPTEEDLLMLYLNGDMDADVVSRLVVAGGTQAASRNPWDDGGVTIVDPDGYRLVLTSRRWP